MCACTHTQHTHIHTHAHTCTLLLIDAHTCTLLLIEILVAPSYGMSYQAVQVAVIAGLGLLVSVASPCRQVAEVRKSEYKSNY